MASQMPPDIKIEIGLVSGCPTCLKRAHIAADTAMPHIKRAAIKISVVEYWLISISQFYFQNDRYLDFSVRTILQSSTNVLVLGAKNLALTESYVEKALIAPCG